MLNMGRNGGNLVTANRVMPAPIVILEQNSNFILKFISLQNATTFSKLATARVAYFVPSHTLTVSVISSIVRKNVSL